MNEYLVILEGKSSPIIVNGIKMIVQGDLFQIVSDHGEVVFGANINKLIACKKQN
jgi:hypothetical protein